jgi:AcrR family transcriptional regulator
MARRAPAPAPAVRRQPRQQRSRERVDRILDATAELIDDAGLDAVTTNSIAEAAEVPVGTLYQFFPNREAVLQGLFERQLEQLDHRFLQLLGAAETTPIPAVVDRVVDALAKAYVEIPALANLVQTVRGDPRFGRLAEANNRSVARFVAVLVRLRAPRLSTARRDAIATTVVEAADAVLMAWLRELRAGRTAPATALLHELRALLVAYVTAAISRKT